MLIFNNFVKYLIKHNSKIILFFKYSSSPDNNSKKFALQKPLHNLNLAIHLLFSKNKKEKNGKKRKKRKQLK